MISVERLQDGYITKEQSFCNTAEENKIQFQDQEAAGDVKTIRGSSSNQAISIFTTSG
jgi:phosphomevalonate kinase